MSTRAASVRPSQERYSANNSGGPNTGWASLPVLRSRNTRVVGLRPIQVPSAR